MAAKKPWTYSPRRNPASGVSEANRPDPESTCQGHWVPARRINEIVHGQRAISADTALRLSRFFGMSERFWLNLQVRYDLEVEKDLLGDRLDREVRKLSTDGVQAVSPEIPEVLPTVITDEELRVQGIRALIAALGEVQAARFVSLLSRAPFDYTKWQPSLWPDVGVEELSREAMKLRRPPEWREANGRPNSTLFRECLQGSRIQQRQGREPQGSLRIDDRAHRS